MAVDLATKTTLEATSSQSYLPIRTPSLQSLTSSFIRLTSSLPHPPDRRIQSDIISPSPFPTIPCAVSSPFHSPYLQPSTPITLFSGCQPRRSTPRTALDRPVPQKQADQQQTRPAMNRGASITTRRHTAASTASAVTASGSKPGRAEQGHSGDVT